MDRFHFLRVSLIEVVQIKFLARSVHVFPRQFFLLPELLLLELSLTFELGCLHFLISIIDFLLVSCIGEDWSFLLRHLHTLLIDFWFECRLKHCRINAIIATDLLALCGIV